MEKLQSIDKQSESIILSQNYRESLSRFHLFICSYFHAIMSSVSSLSLNYEREILNLESANRTQYVESVTILLKLLDNVIREPHNDKYRTIRLENKTIKEKLLSLNGVRELLQKIGFIEVCICSIDSIRYHVIQIN